MCFNNYYILSALLCSTIPVINGQGLSNSPQCSSSGAKTLEVSIKYCQRSWNGAARASCVTPPQCWSLKSQPQQWCTTHCWAPREPFRASHLLQVQAWLLGWHLGDTVTLQRALCPTGVPNTPFMCLLPWCAWRRTFPTWKHKWDFLFRIPASHRSPHHSEGTRELRSGRDTDLGLLYLVWRPAWYFWPSVKVLKSGFQA